MNQDAQNTQPVTETSADLTPPGMPEINGINEADLTPPASELPVINGADSIHPAPGMPEINGIDEADLTPSELDHLRLRERIIEGQISLDIKPNRAMKWLIERTFEKNLLFKALLIFNYFQWIILLPGFVALYYFSWYIGLAILAACFLVAVIVIDKVKRKVLLGGVREYVIKDVASLEGLYSIGAVRFRKSPKGKWIRFPHDWQEAL